MSEKHTMPSQVCKLEQEVQFIYRSKKGCIKVANLMEAKDYDKNPEWEHLATLDAHRWIECMLNNTQKERNKQIKEILK
jgi:hypothetical protein